MGKAAPCLPLLEERGALGLELAGVPCLPSLRIRGI